MTVQELALRLLKMIGVTSLDPASNGNDRNNPGLVDGDLDDIAACINGSIQEVFALAPSFISQRRYADILRPPTQVTIAVTQYSKAVTITGYASWMQGCTIQVPGDPQQNEIESATTVLRPHFGSSGTFTATVWADALPLPSYVREVLEPIEMPLLPFLTPVYDRMQLRSYNQPYQPKGHGRNHVHGVYTNYVTANKQVGIPVVYLVDTFYSEELTYLPLFIRVNPMPQTAYPIVMQITVKPPTITAQDIDFDSGNSDPLTYLPTDWHESILLPVCVMRFSSHPAFKPQSSITEITRQHALALHLLKELKPQVSRERLTYK